MKLFHTFLNQTSCSLPPLKVMHYKDILKLCYGDTTDYYNFFNILLDLLADYSNLSIDFWKKLSLYDIIDCLLALRIFYIGDATTVKYEKAENVTIDISYVFMRNQLKAVYNKHFNVFINKTSLRQIKLAPPSIKEMFDQLQKQNKDFMPSYKFVSEIKQGNLTALITPDDKDFLPAWVSSIASEAVKNWHKDALSVSLLPSFCPENLIFDCSFPSAVNIIKIAFIESLESFYNNLFFLAKHANITPSYIEQCEPGEYFLFVKNLQLMIDQQNQQIEQNSVDIPVEPPQTEA